jgi:DNA-binding IclR family transcriptional regulator
MTEQGPHPALGASSILLKAFDILDAFDRKCRPVLTLSQLARRSALPKSTVHRVIGMLLAVGAVERHGAGYRIGWRVFSLSMASEEHTLLKVALPYVLDLHRETRLPVFVARRCQQTVGYLQQLPHHHERVPAVAGTLRPARDTAEGRTLLAFCSDVEVDAAIAGPPPLSPAEADELRRRLWMIRAWRVALDEESVIHGYLCTVVPVIANGDAVMAVSIAYPSTRGGGRQFVEPLRSVAGNIARVLDHREPSIFSRPTA